MRQSPICIAATIFFWINQSVLILASAALGMAVAVLSCCLCWLDLVSFFQGVYERCSSGPLQA